MRPDWHGTLALPEYCGSAIRVTRFGHRCTLISHNGTLDFCKFTHNHSTYIQSQSFTFSRFHIQSQSLLHSITIIYFAFIFNHTHHTLLNHLHLLRSFKLPWLVINSSIPNASTIYRPINTRQRLLRPPVGNAWANQHSRVTHHTLKSFALLNIVHRSK